MPTAPTVTELPKSREVCPPNYRQWVKEGDKHVHLLESAWKEWFKRLAELENAFEPLVYSNPKLSNFDLRQHRKWVCLMIAEGEELAIAINLSNHSERKKLIPALDDKIAELMDTLLAWHGPAGVQPDIPQSFKDAMSEASSGKFSAREF